MFAFNAKIRNIFSHSNIYLEITSRNKGNMLHVLEHSGLLVHFHYCTVLNIFEQEHLNHNSYQLLFWQKE